MCSLPWWEYMFRIKSHLPVMTQGNTKYWSLNPSTVHHITRNKPQPFFLNWFSECGWYLLPSIPNFSYHHFSLPSFWWDEKKMLLPRISKRFFSRVLYQAVEHWMSFIVISRSKQSQSEVTWGKLASSIYSVCPTAPNIDYCGH